MLKLKNVSKYYSSNEVVALGLNKINLEFRIGEFVAITGESGSGKSTLLNVISGLDTYEDGEMYVNGEETSYYSIEDWESYRSQYIGFVFQNYNIIDSYTVLQNVELALIVQGYDKEARRKRALELIDRVGLTSHKNHKASKLSGGQKQRTVIARALAKDCPIIVCDEPTGNLDSDTSDKIIQLLYEISKEKLVIVVTHNFEEVEKYSTRKVRLFDGEVVEDNELIKITTKDSLPAIETYKLQFNDMMYVAFRNVFSTPKRLVFTVSLFLFIVLTFMISIAGNRDMSNQYGGYYSGVFNNSSESRITVTKYDNEAFTNTELEEIESYKYVRYVNEFDPTIDLTMQSVNTGNYEKDIYLYLNILPYKALNKEDLSRGRFPENKNEIVLPKQDDDYKIGDTLDLYFSNRYGNYEAPQRNTYTIVGILNQEKSGRVAYLHDDLFEELSVTAKTKFLNFQLFQDERLVYDSTNRHTPIKVDKEGLIPNGILYINEEVLIGLCEDYDFENADCKTNVNLEDANLSVTSVFKDYSEGIKVDLENRDDYLNSDGYSYIALSESTFTELINSEGTYQITVIAFDRHEAMQVIDKLETEGYKTLYPYNITSVYDLMGLLFMRVFYVFSMLFLVLVVYFISSLVLKNIMVSKKKDYVVFRSIGASKKGINQILVFELVIQSVIAYLIAIILLTVNQVVESRIPNYLKYFKFIDYIFVYLIVFLLLFLLARKFNKKIFNSSVITSLKGE